MGDRGRKSTDFLEKGLDLFSPLMSFVLGSLALLLFGGPSRLDGGPSHGRSGVNQGEDYYRLGRILSMELAE